MLLYLYKELWKIVRDRLFFLPPFERRRIFRLAEKDGGRDYLNKAQTRICRGFLSLSHLRRQLPHQRELNPPGILFYGGSEPPPYGKNGGLMAIKRFAFTEKTLFIYKYKIIY